MKNELTDEQIKFFENITCEDIGKSTVKGIYDDIQRLVKALQAERAKPKDDVWSQAPKESGYAVLRFYKNISTTTNVLLCVDFTRPLPKTLEEEIAEKMANQFVTKLSGKDQVEGLIICALKEYAARIKQTKGE